MSLSTQEFGLFSKEFTSSIETSGLKTNPSPYYRLGQPHAAGNALCQLFMLSMEPGT